MSFSQVTPGRASAPPVFFPNFERMLREQETIDRERKADALRGYTDPDYWLKRSHGIEWRDDTQEHIAAAVATANFAQMAKAAANTGGAVQNLTQVNQTRGRQRTWIDTLVLAAQASGTTFGVARLPLYAVLLCIELMTDTSLGTATIAFGDSQTAGIYAAAQTLTSINTVVRTSVTGVKGQPITTGYDSVTGNKVTFPNPQTPGQGGLGYEDITMLTAVASLPGSGNLVVMIEYMID
jgi:hypothetical protein